MAGRNWSQAGQPYENTSMTSTLPAGTLVRWVRDDGVVLAGHPGGGLGGCGGGERDKVSASEGE